MRLIKARPQAARVWPHVSRGAPTECWPWRRARNEKGYGVVWTERQRLELAHRIAWELVNGPVPQGMCVRHTCDTPPCCNPEHLILGSQAENMKDKIGRGRHPVGDQAPNAKLSPEKVRSIRRLREAGLSRSERAWLFDVSPWCVQAVDDGRTWRHV